MTRQTGDHAAGIRNDREAPLYAQTSGKFLVNFSPQLRLQEPPKAAISIATEEVSWGPMCYLRAGIVIKGNHVFVEILGIEVYQRSAADTSGRAMFGQALNIDGEQYLIHILYRGLEDVYRLTRISGRTYPSYEAEPVRAVFTVLQK